MEGPEPQLIRFEDGATVPNNPDLPVVLVRGAMPGRSAAEIRARFEEMGWQGTWTWTVFDYHHFHPDAHEALCCASGWADILLGGPEGRLVRVEAGDLAVLPAGTGHRRMASSPDFQMCGSYPPGQSNFLTLREEPDALARHLKTIRSVGLPDSDPVFGPEGPLMKAW